MKVFPEYEQSGQVFQTTVRKFSSDAGDKYYLSIVKDTGLNNFLQSVYLFLFLGKYSPDLTTMEGIKVHQIDANQQSEEQRLKNLYCI